MNNSEHILSSPQKFFIRKSGYEIQMLCHFSSDSNIFIRFVEGNHLVYLLPASALLGASFVQICDILSRVIFAPYELPTGILLSLIGAPFFIAVIFSSSKRRQYDQGK